MRSYVWVLFVVGCASPAAPSGPAFASVPVTNGELVARLDANGKLAASAFSISIDPIDIPDQVFGKPAQLADVRLSLTTAAHADVQWSDDDDATATLAVDLDLAWSLV